MARLFTAVLALVMLALPRFAVAAPLSKPTGDVVLTVKGNISNMNADGAAVFDMAMLDALAGRKAVVETPWTKGKTSFEGPLGKAILDAVGAKGGTMRIRALNDYTVEVPVKDFLDHAVILATKRDGTLMSVREHGPLFVMYPFDQEPSLYNEKFFSRCVWQVASITID